MQLKDAGQVELKLKTPWRDGTTHLVMSPLEFMQRLAALIPRPRPHFPHVDHIESMIEAPHGRAAYQLLNRGLRCLPGLAPRCSHEFGFMLMTHRSSQGIAGTCHFS